MLGLVIMIQILFMPKGIKGLECVGEVVRVRRPFFDRFPFLFAEWGSEGAGGGWYVLGLCCIKHVWLIKPSGGPNEAGVSLCGERKLKSLSASVPGWEGCLG